MPLPLAAFAAGAAAATGAIVRGAQIGALDEGPEYIRDGDPASPLDAVGLFAARQACKVYANNPSAMNDRPAASYERVCRPFLDNIGYGNGPKLLLPFLGGQCPGVLYRVQFSATNDNGSRFTVEQIVGGPVRGAYLDPPDGLGRRTAGIIASLPDGTPQKLGQITLQDPNTNPAQAVSIIRREDNQPDLCGNPPPDYEEPVPPDEPETGPRPFVFAPNFNFDVDVNLDVDGRISIDIGTGPIIVDPFSDGGSEGGSGGYNGPPPAASEPGPEVPGGNGGFGGDDAFGPPPAGKRWVGACVKVLPLTQSQPPIPGTPPEDVYPTVIGNIRLVGNAAGVRVVDTPVRILAKGVCVWEPFRGFFPVAVNVDLVPGYSYTYRPYAVDLKA